MDGSSNDRRYYHTDHLGSTRAVTDGSGQVVERRDHYPFGLQMPGRALAQGPRANEDYTGHALDEETGTHYAGARYYMAALGRWGTTDPVAGLYPGHSPYNYVLNNPLSFFDGTGMCPEGVEHGETYDAGEYYDTGSGTTLCYNSEEGYAVTAERYDEEKDDGEKDEAIDTFGDVGGLAGLTGGSLLTRLDPDGAHSWLKAVSEGRVAPLPEGRELQVMGARTLRRAGWVATGAIALYEIKEAETTRERGRVATRTLGGIGGGAAAGVVVGFAGGCAATGPVCVAVGIGAGAVGTWAVGEGAESGYDWLFPPPESASE